MLEVLRNLDCPVIVEGKRDKQTLTKIGVDNIIPLNGKSLYNFTFDYSEKFDQVLVLTDFDKEGKRLAGKLTSFFESMGVKIKGKLRKDVMKLSTSNGKSHVEDLQKPDLIK